MGRHEQREQIFKLLFRVEFHSMEDIPEQVRLFLTDDEVFELEKDTEYVSERFDMIKSKITELDELINKNVDGWSTDRMGKVELAVLRLGVYEILFDDSIPGRVAVNEAVEIAKKYGQENSGAFVNAVLAKFMKTGD